MRYLEDAKLPIMLNVTHGLQLIVVIMCATFLYTVANVLFTTMPNMGLQLTNTSHKFGMGEYFGLAHPQVPSDYITKAQHNLREIF
jgi:hypothetical protein